jgi:hypothetical protein
VEARPSLSKPANPWRSCHEPIEHVDGTVEVVPIPADRTGEAALESDPLAEDHDRLVATVNAIADAADDIIRLVRKAVPTPLAVLRPDDMTPAQVSAAGWCVSCWTDGTYHEPVAMRPNGHRRYRDLCLFCGEFAAAHDGVRPPLELLQARHRGERITAAMIDRAFARLEEEKREQKAARKKGKKRRTAA